MDHSHMHHHHDHNMGEVESGSSSTIASPTMHDTHNAHDHSASSDSVMQHAVHHMMSMAFHGGCNETILFEQWKTSSVGGLIFSMLIIFVLAMLYEGLKYYREHLFWKSYNALQYRAVTLPEKNDVTEDNNRVVHIIGGEVITKTPPSMCSLMHYYQTFLHLVQITLSYALMLIFMIYNVYLCLAVVIGAAFGYFLFGWKKSVIVDVTEHCH